MINETLKHNILSNIPENYTNLKKALLIYKRFCETVDYSLEYYLRGNEVIDQFTDKENLKYVDGINNKDVVCITFNVILIELFKEANVLQEIINPGYREKDNKFVAEHRPIGVVIDGINFCIEGTSAVIDNNDLILSKYSTHMPIGWTIYPEGLIEKEEILSDSIEEVYMDNFSLENDVEEYLELSCLNLDYPLEERFNTFMKILLGTDDNHTTLDYSLLSYNKILNLKYAFFTESEIMQTPKYNSFGYEPIENKKIDITFVKEQKTGEFKVLVYFNPEGYSASSPERTVNNLKIYDISLLNKTCEELSREEILDRFDDRYYVSRTGNGIFASQMAAQECDL